jgi:hypothetical protein
MLSIVLLESLTFVQEFHSVLPIIRVNESYTFHSLSGKVALSRARAWRTYFVPNIDPNVKSAMRQLVYFAPKPPSGPQHLSTLLYHASYERLARRGDKAAAGPEPKAPPIGPLRLAR